jgi:2-oxoglutarate ferredoxin oxidoreductase subunit gamma
MMAGIGGRGILMMGRLLSEAGMTKYKHVSYFPNYGAEMRGGDSEVTVILSDDEIASQVTLHPQVAIVMNPSFFKPMEERVKPGGMILVDCSVVSTKLERDDITVYYLPVTQKALDMGNVQVANIILLGAYLEATRAVSIEAVEQALEKRIRGTSREALLSLNKEALEEGGRLIRGSRG